MLNITYACRLLNRINKFIDSELDNLETEDKKRLALLKVHANKLRDELLGDFNHYNCLLVIREYVDTVYFAQTDYQILELIDQTMDNIDKRMADIINGN